jgi:hypothetical protein
MNADQKLYGRFLDEGSAVACGESRLERCCLHFIQSLDLLSRCRNDHQTSFDISWRLSRYNIHHCCESLPRKTVELNPTSFLQSQCSSTRMESVVVVGRVAARIIGYDEKPVARGHRRCCCSPTIRQGRRNSVFSLRSWFQLKTVQG